MSPKLLMSTVSVAVSMVGYLAYVASMFHISRRTGQVIRPERSSWMSWAVIYAISLIAQIEQGATFSLWFFIAQTAGVWVVAILSVWRGYGSWGWRDGLNVSLACIGGAFMVLCHSPAVAILILLGIETAGIVQMLPKTYQDPGSEAYTMWVTATIGGLCDTLAVGATHNYYLYVAPAGVTCINLAVVLTLRLGHWRQSAFSLPG